MKSGIYCITHKDSGRKYWGSANNIDKRWNSHQGTLQLNKHGNRFLQSAWNKYGPEAFQWDKIEECAPIKASLLELEQLYFDTYVVWGFDFNINRFASSGLGTIRSEETRRKISEAQIGRPPRSEEARKKISIANKGRKASEETRKRLSEARIKRAPHSDETKRKMAEAATGRSMPEELKLKLWNLSKGRIPTEKARQNMSEAQKRRAPMSIETRQKLATALKGNTNGCKPQHFK